MLGIKDLHQYQNKGVNHILDNRIALMMLKMGLGKTVTGLTAFNILKYDMFQVTNCLVIAPKKVVQGVWKQEAAKWDHLKHLKIVRVIGTPKQRAAALRTPADIHVVGRDVIPWLCAHYGGSLPFDMLIIDELSSFKNTTSKRWKALKMITPSFKYRIGLTGTPSPNSLLELWPQVFLLDQGERLGRFITHFKRAFFNGETGYAKGGRQFEKHTVREDTHDAIYERLSDITLSMGLECLDMPERVDVDVMVELSDKDLRAYKKFRRDSYIELITESSTGEVTAMNAAVLTNKLLQFANGSIYDRDKNIIRIHDAKLEKCEELIEEANGHPVLILYSYKHGRDRLLERFGKMGAEVLGDEESVERWNRGEIPILLMHPASGGHGLNLQAGGSIMIWYGMTWSLELYEQTVARLYRQGQVSDTVSIFHLLCAKTMDVRVRDVLNGKAEGQKALMDALKEEMADMVELKGG